MAATEVRNWLTADGTAESESVTTGAAGLPCAPDALSPDWHEDG